VPQGKAHCRKAGGHGQVVDDDPYLLLTHA
jgi:hypothetical protein